MTNYVSQLNDSYPIPQGPLLSESSFFSFVNSYPEYWEYAEYPYSMLSNTQGLIRVHGVLTFHRIPGHKDVEISGKQIGERKRTALGLFEWRGQIGDDAYNQGTGWRQINE